jgi:hypothetical protein
VAGSRVQLCKSVLNATDKSRPLSLDMLAKLTLRQAIVAIQDQLRDHDDMISMDEEDLHVRFTHLDFI